MDNLCIILIMQYVMLPATFMIYMYVIDWKVSIFMIIFHFYKLLCSSHLKTTVNNLGIVSMY